MSKQYVHKFDVTAEYESERHILKELNSLAEGWAYAMNEGVPLCVITSLQSDSVFNVSPCLFRSKEALAAFLWRSL